MKHYVYKIIVQTRNYIKYLKVRWNFSFLFHLPDRNSTFIQDLIREKISKLKKITNDVFGREVLNHVTKLCSYTPEYRNKYCFLLRDSDIINIYINIDNAASVILI